MSEQVPPGWKAPQRNRVPGCGCPHPDWEWGRLVAWGLYSNPDIKFVNCSCTGCGGGALLVTTPTSAWFLSTPSYAPADWLEYVAGAAAATPAGSLIGVPHPPGTRAWQWTGEGWEPRGFVDS